MWGPAGSTLFSCRCMPHCCAAAGRRALLERDRTCVSYVDLGHNCDVSILRLLRLRRRLGLGVLAVSLVAIPLTLLPFSVRAEWDQLRVVDRGSADGLGMVTHQSWAVAALKANGDALDLRPQGR
jgi:hypothetical protein